MATVTIIPASRQMGNRQQEGQKKLRVAAYCRMSTDSEEQENSYETQVSHYEEYIKSHPGWELAGIFADDGISGTNTKKREKFNRMIEACEEGKIDLVVTKSISRFARNTLDCLKYIRLLKKKNIAVWFEKEAINTLDAKGEVLLTIMASLAQQESQSLSQNVRLGLAFRYQSGKVIVNHHYFLGYTKDAEGKLMIDPKQAETVRHIFREYLEGHSTNKIAKGLEADGLLTGAGRKKWYSSTINKILRNEKYMGDALWQKTVTTDFLTKKREVNSGLLPQYYVEDDHEAIIPKDIFLETQAEIARRSVVHSSPSGRRHAFSDSTCFSQLVVCGECGELYRRVHWNNRGRKAIVWRCVSRLAPAKAAHICENRMIKEETLKLVSVQALNKILTSRDEFLEQLEKNVTKVVLQTHFSPAMIEKRLGELQQKLIEKAGSHEDYEAVATEILRLRKEKEQAKSEAQSIEKRRKRIKDLQQFIRQQDTP